MDRIESGRRHSGGAGVRGALSRLETVLVSGSGFLYNEA